MFFIAAKTCPAARRNLYLFYVNKRMDDKAKELRKQLPDKDLPPIPATRTK
ncbi:MAG: hypothetical protein IJS01_07235 [Lentisphaeria bacterium]|nr:hypothetical protein [Lentisphaeria bacterium]